MGRQNDCYSTLLKTAEEPPLCQRDAALVHMQYIAFICKTPPAAVLLRKAAGLKKGSGEPNTNKVGKVNRAQLEEIATTKMPDLTASDMDAAVRTVAGTARSMGIDVEGVK